MPPPFFLNFEKTIDCKELERSVAIRLPFAEILMCQLSYLFFNNFMTTANFM